MRSRRVVEANRTQADSTILPQYGRETPASRIKHDSVKRRASQDLTVSQLEQPDTSLLVSSKQCIFMNLMNACHRGMKSGGDRPNDA